MPQNATALGTSALGNGTAANHSRCFAGRAAVVAPGLTTNQNATIYNDAITDNSIVIVTGCEESPVSTAATVYTANVAYDSSLKSWNAVTSRNVSGANKSFDVTVRQAASGNMAAGSGCIVSYLIIN